MTLRVGRIPYLSCEPFYFDMARRDWHLVDLVPSALAQALEQGEIDAGPAPVADCFRLEDRFRLLSGFCLATIRQTGSVWLHAKRPIEDLSDACIGVTSDAATSLRLLQILLALKHQVQPNAYVTLDDPNDACLLIGNQGLRQRTGLDAYPHRYDLGEEWTAWTSLPFVFVHWLVRLDLDPKLIAQLEDALYVGLQDWADGLFRFASSRDDLLMRARDILSYTQGIRYFSGRPEQRSMALFRQYLEQLHTPLEPSGDEMAEEH
ncbi:menaquinone biosynthetic enzyme MqnA/MqnD family protein [Candidatus Entotheonella palauensis]|uniref:menaquinone biosynthetic enzyme MqnA/MqnD family protein n=1 Tax=Candidatus Entotheonella palauensis TaxID=93172 RepID=UPI0015C4975F|nr:MqnA/MqnD/SBP family protein [Candidatus Entotheonella palauensis]